MLPRMAHIRIDQQHPLSHLRKDSGEIGGEPTATLSPSGAGNDQALALLRVGPA